MANRQFLVVSESFYSIQGEGASAGTPAVFLRLAGCNLRCEGFSYRDPVNGEHLGCDTKQVWQQGKRRNFSEIIAYWDKLGWLAKLAQGAHLVITGGEPLLQQTALISFMLQLDQLIAPKLFIEMETNATILPADQLLQRVDQFNVSPKLTHSGETRLKAYQPTIVLAFKQSNKARFKFVIAEPHDVAEMVADYIEPLQLDPRSIWLMPEGGTREIIDAKKPWLVEVCKEHLFNFTSRLQVDIWQEVVGV